MKYYQVNRDQVKINGIDINDYCLSGYKRITYVSQKEMLFTDTENNLNINPNDKENFRNF